MPTTDVNGVQIYFDRFGSESDPTILMVAGLGAQCLVYEDEVCERIAAAGHHVVRYDNRDVGLSTHFDGAEVDPFSALLAAASGEEVSSPYTLSDMAADGIELLSSLDIEQADVFGASMGGMIAQTMAIEAPQRVRSLTSLMSTTGEPDVGQPDAEVLGTLLSVMTPSEERSQRIDNAVALARIIGTRDHFDEERARERATTFVDRSYDPEGTSRQLVAIFASGSRAAGLSALDLPTIVLHGDADLLVDISGGHRTAELVPGAEFRLLAGMAHDMPPAYSGELVGAILDNAARSAR